MPNPYQPSWVLRRVAIFGLLVFSCLVVAFVVVFGDPSNSIHTSALAWGFGAAVATVFSYAGFATLEDVSLAKLLR